MRFLTVLTPALLLACSPEGELQPELLEAGMEEARSATKQTDDFEITDGTTVATQKGCDPSDPRCVRWIADGGDTNIHPYDLVASDRIDLGGGGVFATTNHGLRGVGLLISSDISELQDAARYGRAAIADAHVVGFDGADVAYLHVVDEDLRTGELSLAIELDDGVSTTTLAGGVPSGEYAARSWTR